MSTFTIILETRSISVDSSYRYIGGQIGRRATPALTFDIRKGPNDEWYLFYNQGTFAGKYPTQAAAMGILYGIYTAFNGLDDGFSVWIADSLGRGSYIESDENVLTLSLSKNGSDVTTVLGDIDFVSLLNGQTFPFGVYLGYQIQDPGSSTWNSASISDSNVTITVADDGNTKSATTSSGVWTTLLEGASIRPCVIGFGNPSVVLLSGAPTTKPYQPGLANVSLAPSGVTLNGGSVEFIATAVADESQPSRPLPSDLVYTYTITAPIVGDITTVTSANPSTGRFYTLTYDYSNNTDRANDVLRIEVVASSASLSASFSETTSATLQYPTSPVIPVIDFEVEVSGTTAAGADVELGDNAYAVITDSSTGGTPSFSYEWYQSVPTLTGITLTNEGP